MIMCQQKQLINCIFRVLKMKINNKILKEINKKFNNEKKTQKEIYEEIIKKSKLYKYERTKQREENIDLLQSVNESYNDIKSLLFFRNKDIKH